jgi:hypothetical protein
MLTCPISVFKVGFGLELTAAKSLLVVARFGSTSQVNENKFFIRILLHYLLHYTMINYRKTQAPTSAPAFLCFRTNTRSSGGCNTQGGCFSPSTPLSPSLITLLPPSLLVCVRWRYRSLLTVVGWPCYECAGCGCWVRRLHSTRVRLARPNEVVGLASRVMAEVVARCTRGKRLGSACEWARGEGGE